MLHVVRLLTVNFTSSSINSFIGKSFTGWQPCRTYQSWWWCDSEDWLYMLHYSFNYIVHILFPKWTLLEKKPMGNLSSKKTQQPCAMSVVILQKQVKGISHPFPVANKKLSGKLQALAERTIQHCQPQRCYVQLHYSYKHTQAHSRVLVKPAGCTVGSSRCSCCTVIYPLFSVFFQLWLLLSLKQQVLSHPPAGTPSSHLHKAEPCLWALSIPAHRCKSQRWASLSTSPPRQHMSISQSRHCLLMAVVAVLFPFPRTISLTASGRTTDTQTCLT